MGLRGSLRGWSCICLRRSRRGRLSGKDPGGGLFSKGVNFIGIHRRPTRFLKKLFQQKLYQLGLRETEYKIKGGCRTPKTGRKQVDKTTQLYLSWKKRDDSEDGAKSQEGTVENYFQAANLIKELLTSVQLDFSQSFLPFISSFLFWTQISTALILCFPGHVCSNIAIQVFGSKSLVSQLDRWRGIVP